MHKAFGYAGPRLVHLDVVGTIELPLGGWELLDSDGEVTDRGVLGETDEFPIAAAQGRVACASRPRLRPNCLSADGASGTCHHAERPCEAYTAGNLSTDAS